MIPGMDVYPKISLKILKQYLRYQVDKERRIKMNFLDLTVVGIETQISEDADFTTGAVKFRFRKGDIYAERIISREELVCFNGGLAMLESFLCEEALRLISEEKKKL